MLAGDGVLLTNAAAAAGCPYPDLVWREVIDAPPLHTGATTLREPDRSVADFVVLLQHVAARFRPCTISRAGG